MYNLMIVGSENYWDETTEKTLDYDRVLSFTSESVKSQFMPLDNEKIAKLCALPALFVYEFANRAPKTDDVWAAPALLGRIQAVEEQPRGVVVTFKIDRDVEPIHTSDILRLASQLDIKLSDGESYRTHWSVKDIDLIELLKREALLRSSKMSVAEEFREIAEDVAKPRGETHKVLIVHGHDTGAKHEVARFLQKIGLAEVILDEQPNEGLTIIEKLEKFAAFVDFAVVLMTADDVGGPVGKDQSFRARQNVIFELGYLYSKLGKSKVAALAASKVEIPTDLGGIFFIPYDTSQKWQSLLARELQAAKLNFDIMAGL